MTEETTVAFVSGSSVRRDALLAVASEPDHTRSLIDRIGASESAVYNALSALERRQLVRSRDDRWEATGAGRLVADLLRAESTLDELLSAYWRTHSVEPVPHRLRLRVGELAGAEVVRASDTDPYGVVREITDRMAATDDVDVISPIYQPDYVETMPDAETARLILDPSVLEDTLGEEDVEVRVFDRTAVRVLDVDLAMSVTASSLTLSLPTLDGDFDAMTTVIADNEDAREWGGDLFDHYWERATPVEELLASLDVDLAEVE